MCCQRSTKRVVNARVGLTSLSLAFAFPPPNLPTATPRAAIGAVVDTSRRRRGRTSGPWPRDKVNRSRWSRHELRRPANAAGGRRPRQSRNRTVTIAALAPTRAAEPAATAAADGSAARQPRVSGGSRAGSCLGGNPQRYHGRCWPFRSPAPRFASVLRLLPGKKRSLPLLLFFGVPWMLLWWSGSSWWCLPVFTRTHPWPPRLSPPTRDHHRRSFSCCWPAFALALERVRGRLRRLRRVVGWRAPAVVGDFFIVASAATIIAVTVVYLRRPPHVRPPVDEELVCRSSSCTASSNHALFRLHPD